jgi:putative NIF3 family GTP cyclohydrolase 1 type 2
MTELLSRRQFARLTGGAAAACPFAAAQKTPLTAIQVIERIKQGLGVPWNADTVDTFKAGSPQTLVKGIATTFMATLDVLQRSAAAGLNFVISHEPTFWNHRDITTQWEDDAVFKFKTAFIEKNGMVVHRIHDSIHARKPDMIFVGFDQALGWEKYRVGEKLSYVLPSTTVEAIARHMAEKLNTRSIRLIGDPALKVSKVTVSGHSALNNQAALPDCDVQILFEAWERDSAEYWRDTVASGQQKALILTAHEVGEESGMDTFAHWLRNIVSEVPIQYIPAGDKFWIPS